VANSCHTARSSYRDAFEAMDWLGIMVGRGGLALWTRLGRYAWFRASYRILSMAGSPDRAALARRVRRPRYVVYIRPCRRWSPPHCTDGLCIHEARNEASRSTVDRGVEEGICSGRMDMLATRLYIHVDHLWRGCLSSTKRKVAELCGPRTCLVVRGASLRWSAPPRCPENHPRPEVLTLRGMAGAKRRLRHHQYARMSVFGFVGVLTSPPWRRRTTSSSGRHRFSRSWFCMTSLWQDCCLSGQDASALRNAAPNGRVGCPPPLAGSAGYLF
jgi:hypothetical protein